MPFTGQLFLSGKNLRALGNINKVYFGTARGNSESYTRCSRLPIPTTLHLADYPDSRYPSSDTQPDSRYIVYLGDSNAKEIASNIEYGLPASGKCLAYRLYSSTRDLQMLKFSNTLEKVQYKPFFAKKKSGIYSGVYESVYRVSVPSEITTAWMRPHCGMIKSNSIPPRRWS